jgi:hypothetical protein
MRGPEGWFTFALRRRAERTGQAFGLEGFQLVLSDPDGRMPWDKGYNGHLRPRQPALWLPANESDAAWEMSSIELAARRLVRERGWATMPVDGPALQWAYTIGFPESLGAPELITFGHDGEGCGAMLAEIQRHLGDGGPVLHDGLRWDGLGPELCWRRVHPQQYLGVDWMHLAKDIREARTGHREAVEVFQAFVPDEAGRYPWEDGCDPDFRALQPLLYLPPEEEPHARRMLAAAGRL